MFWFIVTFIVFVLVAALRYRLGTDSIRYERFFINGPTLSTLSSYDFSKTRFSPFYIFLNASIRSLTDQFIVFQFVHAIIVNTVFFYFFYKNCEKIFFSILIFFFFLYFTLTMEVLREAFSVCVFLLAWPFFRDGKWFQWYVMSAIAFFLHTSGVFMFILPLAAVPGVKQLFIFGKRTVLIIIAVYAAAIFIRAKFFDYIQALSLFESVTERAEMYSKTELASSKLNIGGMVGSAFRFVIYPFIALFFLCRDNHKIFPRDGKLVAMILISIYVGVVTTVMSVFYRFGNYLTFFNIVALSYFVYSYVKFNFKKVRFQFVTWVIFFLPMFFFQFQQVYMGGANMSGTLKMYSVYYPYASRFDMTKDEKREKVFAGFHAY